jgi:hypothetical protein
MEQRWNDTDREKSNKSEINLSQYHFIHHKNTIWTALATNLVLCGQRPSVNRLSCGTDILKGVSFQRIKI